MINRKFLPVLCVLSAGALFAAGTPLAKLLLNDMQPLTLASVLYLGSAAGLLIFYIFSGFLSGKTGKKQRHTKEAPLTKEDLPWLAGSVLFGSILSTVILMISLPHVPAVTASMLLSFEAVAGTAIAATIFHEPVGKRVWTALGLITLACLLLTYTPGAETGLSLGALGVILTCTCWGIDCNLGRKISSKDPVSIVLAKGLGAGIVLFILAEITGSHFPPLPEMIPAMIVGFFSFGGLMVTLYFYGLRGLGSARAGSIFGMNPAFGVIFSFIIFQDIPGAMFFLVLPLVALGLYLLATENHSHIHTHPAESHEHRHSHDDLHHDHEHSPGSPPVDKNGHHSHIHTHEEFSHEHPHRPDIHHRHRHE
jgi:drug/metabolite transporter (DMT)-like permease